MPASRLLLIDDEEGFRRLMARVAQSVGFEVITTADPAQFVNTARSWHPAVIVMDLMMPGIDGIQLLRDLAADDCASHVVLASGVDAKVLEVAETLGRERGLRMSGTLVKPVRIEAVRNLLLAFEPMPKSLRARDLGEAIANGELFLEYQPELDCRRDVIVGAEALVRWRRSDGSIVQPGHFIELAEESGLIPSLTDWVVRKAARQRSEWQQRGLQLRIAVNISAIDLQDLGLPDRLEAFCRDAGTEPATITLELTESAAMREPVQMMDVLTRLRLKGFGLAIDDFGTGYSSLVQLQRMPFSEIKIDRSFVQQMTRNNGCRVIAEIVIDLAHKLGLNAVAEGVEDQEALDSLKRMGCDGAQGYHISPPIAAERIVEVAPSTSRLNGRLNSSSAA